MEDYVYVLDYLEKGRADMSSFKRHPVVYGLGETQFTILELVPKQNETFTPGERIYVGKNGKKREKISKIKGRINYDNLTSTAHGELPYVIQDIVQNNEQRFVKFFNEAPAISTRFHVLELLPGLGKKMMHEIIAERRKKPFESFKEMSERIDFLRDPIKLISKRIEEELINPDEKYRIFTRPPVSKSFHS